MHYYPLLTPAETSKIRQLYLDDHLFRATIDMRRYRFGEGEYRYFEHPYSEPIEQLKQALYPRLLPIARDCGPVACTPPPWPDTLDERLLMCHARLDEVDGHPTSGTARATGTRYTETSTATWCFHCRW